MKVTIITINGRKYEHRNITSVIERKSNTSGKVWLVLKNQSHKNVTKDEVAEKDYLKISLDQVESIRYD